MYCSASFHELSHSCLWMCSVIHVMWIPKCRIIPGLPLKQVCTQETCCFHKSGKASIHNHLKCSFFYLSPVLKSVARPEILYHIYEPFSLLIEGWSSLMMSWYCLAGLQEKGKMTGCTITWVDKDESECSTQIWRSSFDLPWTFPIRI